MRLVSLQPSQPLQQVILIILGMGQSVVDWQLGKMLYYSVIQRILFKAFKEYSINFYHFDLFQSIY